MSDRFAARTPWDVADLVCAQPFCWIVPMSEAHATLAPLLTRRGADGGVVGFEGHVPRRHRLVDILRSDPEALVLCLGPHAYISASWMRERSWAPTWNFAQAQFQVEIAFFDDDQSVEQHLRELTLEMEGGRDNAWRVEEMGERFHHLARGVIGFRAHVTRQEARFKLGQDEGDRPFADILRALNGRSDDLAAWMRRFNPHRLEG